MQVETSFLDIAQTKFGFKDKVKYVEEFPKGLSREVVEKISKIKNEPEWMLKLRLRAFDHFMKRQMPKWGGDLSTIDFNEMIYFISPTNKVADKWEDVQRNGFLQKDY